MQKFHSAELNKHQVERDRARESVEDFFKRMIASRESAEAKNRMDYHAAQASMHADEAAKAAEKFSELSKQYGLAILKEIKGYAQPLDELIVLVRAELGLETSQEELSATTAEMQEAAEMALQKLYDDLQPSADLRNNNN
jgi:hypothetical protein